MRALPARLLVVTDLHQAQRPLPAIVEDLVETGVRWIWLRDRDADPAGRRTLAEQLAGLLRRAGGTLTVGDDPRLAQIVGAGGVQLRRPAAIAAARLVLGGDVLLGLSAHGLQDVAEATAAGADYATLSPIYTTSSKPGYGPALGQAALTSASRIGMPVLALGGVTPDRAADCRAAGAAGIAVMGPLMRAETSRHTKALAAEFLQASR